ncbi:hypothetical protein CR513_56711, partial [Mucuna pruriens]
MDFISGLPRAQGKDMILAVVDRLTKALYGRDLPPIIHTATYPSKVEAVHMLAEEKDGILDELKNLHKAQNRMKQQADQKHRDIQFQVEDWVYLKAQPQRLQSSVVRKSEKLAPKYYGPFKIYDCVGAVTYKLKLSPNSKIHSIFHISKLKKAIPSALQPQSFPVGLIAN